MEGEGSVVSRGEGWREAREEGSGIDRGIGMVADSEEILGDVIGDTFGDGGVGGAVVTWLNSPGLLKPLESWKRKSVKGL